MPFILETFLEFFVSSEFLSLCIYCVRDFGAFTRGLCFCGLHCKFPLCGVFQNKKERKKVREVGILKKDPDAIKEQIKKLEIMSVWSFFPMPPL